MEEAFIRAGRINFYWYCKVREPDFYKPDRPHLKKLCETLDDFLNDRLLKEDGTPYNKLQIAMPPRHGKSRTLVNLCQWALGRDPFNERIIWQGYSDGLAEDSSRYIRDGIVEVRQTPDQYVFSDFFPNATINRSNKSVKKWALQGSFMSMLASGVDGLVTGKGGRNIIVDDPVKNAEEALNERNLEKLWLWFTGTLLSRSDADKGVGKMILNHTRWSKNDLAGRLQREEKGEWYILEMPVYDSETDTMLCEDILSKEEYFRRRSLAFKDNRSKMIFMANFHQRIMELEGTLITNFTTYDPEGFVANTRMRMYIDYADTGKDYFFAIWFTSNRKSDIFIHDIMFTDDKQELYEPELLRKMNEYKPYRVFVESQAGGKQATKSLLKMVKYKRPKNDFQPFHQNLNKKVKILRYSKFVSEKFRYPKGWDLRWPRFHEHMTTFQAVIDNNTILDGMDGCCEVIRREKYARRGGMKRAN
jgi:predicted phage terminase large subunit-like protein